MTTNPRREFEIEYGVSDALDRPIAYAAFLESRIYLLEIEVEKLKKQLAREARHD